MGAMAVVIATASQSGYGQTYDYFDSDVDYDRARTNPISLYHVWISGGGDQDIRGAADPGQVPGSRMAHRHGRIVLLKQN